jgi:hypothetical protein
MAALAHEKRQALPLLVEQASANPATPTCMVDLDAFEALGVALTLRALIHDGTIPPMAADAYKRVSGQLEAAAKLAMRGGGR